MQGFSTYRSGYARHAVWCVGVLIAAALFCIAPAHGQAIPDEGYPSKPVFPEEPAAAPALHEECDPVRASDAFAGECAGDMGDAGGNGGADGAGNGVVGSGASGVSLDPALRTPPRLECPSAVFLEELQTGAIDCHASDAAGEEHLDYFWEPIGRSTGDYLENPRLLPEDAPNPVVVAPSFPQYDTLESFLAEEGAQRYRYRLTATSRATGLSSHAEVEVFVRSSQPSVYCPLELEVEEGDTVVLACEGADPLSFRMDASDERGGGSLALWAWEGLWESSTAPLAATDTPQPLFTAPAGSAGNTYHYVASLTTSSSGVPRTARRRVSVTVKAGEEAGLGADISRSASNASPVITCGDPNVHYRSVSGHSWEAEITECTVDNPAALPEGATYTWAAVSPSDGLDRLVRDETSLTPIFSIEPIDVPFGREVRYEYTVTLAGTGITTSTATIILVLRRESDASGELQCQWEYEAWTGEEDFELYCTHGRPGERVRWTMSWTSGSGAYLYDGPPASGGTQGPPLVTRENFGLWFDVPEVLPEGTTVAHYVYIVCIYYDDDGDGVFSYVDSGRIRVTVQHNPNVELECDPTHYALVEGEDAEQEIDCDLYRAGLPLERFTIEWTSRDDSRYLDHLDHTDIVSPTFTMPSPVKARSYVYDLKVSVPSNSRIEDMEEHIIITVSEAERPEVIIDCPGDPYEYTAGDGQVELSDCSFSTNNMTTAGATYSHQWTEGTVARSGLLDPREGPAGRRPFFNVPNSVSGDETYEYTLTIMAENTSTRESATASETITAVVKPRPALSLSCTNMTVYEGSGSHDLNCEGIGLPKFPHYGFTWSPDDGFLEEAAPPVTYRTVHPPKFLTPANVDVDTDYTYQITLKSDRHVRPPWSRTSPITVTVLNKPQIVVNCTSATYSAYEGSSVVLDCTASGAHDPSTYTYAWTAQNAAADLGRLGSGQNALSPTFTAPASVTAEKTHEYLLTVSADNAVDGTFMVAVTERPKPPLMVDCVSHPYEVYEGSSDVLDCTVAGAPDPSTYAYAWTARSSAADVTLLSDAAALTPTFTAPASVPAPETHEYVLTVTADNALDGTFDADVKVLPKPPLAVDCPDTPYSVFEGEADFPLNCTVTGAPDPSTYAYAWTARSPGTGTDLGLLDNPGALTPTFLVPPDVAADRAHEYVLTVTAANALDVTANVTVTVRDRPLLAVACVNPAPVYEGSAAFALECTATGAPAGAAYTYAWTPRGDTPDAALLNPPDALTPMFLVPEAVDRDETYEYLLTVSADNSVSGTAEVTVEVLNKPQLAVDCTNPAPVYEGEADFSLNCTASGAPAGAAYTYAWTPRGDTPDVGLLSASNVLSPTFDVPPSVAQTTRYEYALTVSAANAESGSETVTVTVLNEGSLALVCTDPDPVYEGSADIALSCTASGAPGNSPSYEYTWTSRGAAEDADLLSRTDISSPTFDVPAAVEADRAYEYLVTASAANADAGTARVTVTVLNQPVIAVVCTDPDPVYEGSADIALSCSASGALGDQGAQGAQSVQGADPVYAYAWTAQNPAAGVGLLSNLETDSPVFDVPEDVAQTTTYEYLVTASAANADAGMAEVRVTVLNKGALALACADPAPVYEGSPDITLNCTASGGPDGSVHDYTWTAQGSTPRTLLSATDMSAPTFFVPEEVPQTTQYEYLVTASAANAEAATAEVTVTVLNKGALALVCVNPAPVYEGAPDVALDCSASGAPGAPAYEYLWTAQGSTPGTLLSATDMSAPTFFVPEEVPHTTRYEYLVTASAADAEDATALVTVTVLDSGVLTLACANPAPVYEGAPDVALNCTTVGGPDGSVYEYVWSALPNASSAVDTGLLSRADIASPTFAVPAEVDADETYAYLVTVSAENAEAATAEVTVTVLNKGALALACVNPAPVYEGSPDVALDCSATGALAGSAYEYVWTALSNTSATPDTDLLSATDIASPMFYVPIEVDADERYEYLVTVSAENADPATAEVTVTVLNKGDLALVCVDPDPVYEGDEDITLFCAASGGPEGSVYEYVWSPHGATLDTERLVAGIDGPTPTFAVPEEVDQDETYEYLVTASAENAEDATAEVLVTVLNSIPPVAFSTIPSNLGVWISASSLRFGVQSSGAQVTLDALTDRISTSVAGPYHVGRMTLAPEGDLAFDENAEVALSIEMASEVVLRHVSADSTALALSPNWSYTESCEQLSSQSIPGSYTEVRMSGSDCRLLLFGGDLDLTDAPSGRYVGTIDVIFRTVSGEETHLVPVSVEVIPAPRVIAIGPGGVRFDTSRELPAGLTPEQTVRIYPDVAYLTEEAPSGVFELSNPSLIPLEIAVSSRFGYVEATADGREAVVEDPSVSRLGDLSGLVEMYPQSLVLQPGEQRVVRYGVREDSLAALKATNEAGYAAFFEISSAPRQYIRADWLPEASTGENMARVTMRVPGAYAPESASPSLRAELLSVSAGASPSATFLLETEGAPFLGEVAAYDEDGREIGRSRTLVYTRSRVRLPLAWLPEGEAIFLHFAPFRAPSSAPSSSLSGSEHTSEPVRVPWDAPRGIGAVPAKDTSPAPPASPGSREGPVLADQP